MRLFKEQLEAMMKLKGRASQQKVTVEHVHALRANIAETTLPALITE